MKKIYAVFCRADHDGIYPQRAWLIATDKSLGKRPLPEELGFTVESVGDYLEITGVPGDALSVPPTVAVFGAYGDPTGGVVVPHAAWFIPTESTELCLLSGMARQDVVRLAKQSRQYISRVCIAPAAHVA